MRRSPSTGWGPWRRDWISICSMHYIHDPSCSTCMTGQYRNRWAGHMSRFVYRHWPHLWRYWANRRWLNPHSRWLESVFPNLRLISHRPSSNSIGKS